MGLVSGLVELRQLEAFVAVATELHFGRAAERLHVAQPTLSELIRRLEREVGTPLLTRTTRRVTLTGAGLELLGRAKVILDDVTAATAAVRRVARGDAGTVQLGITPPVAPVLAPHLAAALNDRAPEVELIVRRMWAPDLSRALGDGTVDVGMTCGRVPDPPGVVGETFCAEPLFVVLRENHRLADRPGVTLADLARDRLGIPSTALFPAWAVVHRQVLDDAGIQPPMVELAASDLAAAAWTSQSDVDWIISTAALAGSTTGTVVRPIEPQTLMPHKLQWNPDRAQTAAVARFVHLALTLEVPTGWHTQPAHLRHGFSTRGDV
jgi:DNA-binding transcriptional LysR family regulator